jgi:hypothetical protein
MIGKHCRYSLWLLFLLCQGSVLFAQKPAGKMSVADYILKYQELALKKSGTYRIPASIILGQGILESANGNSELAVQANNHFGVKCHKDWKGDTYLKDDDKAGECFRKYKSVDDSYEDHGIFLSTRDRYAFLFQLDPMDYKAWAHGLKQAGYATNPDYARLLIKVIEDNRLYEIDKGNLAMAALPPAIKHKVGRKPGVNESFEAISLGGPPREVWENNGVDFVYARQGDDLDKIAKALGLMPWQLRRYNDLDKDHSLSEGEIVYIKSKKRKAQTEIHVIASGEDLWRISQRYGVKLKILCRRNHLDAGTNLSPGMTIFLNKSASQ